MKRAVDAPPRGWGPAGARSRAALVTLVVLLGCDPIDAPPDAAIPPDAPACATPILLDLSAAAELTVDAPTSCPVTLRLAEARVVDAWVESGRLRLAGAEGAYLEPTRLDAGDHPLELLDATGAVHVRDLGAPPGALRIERSLTWSDPALLDDATTVGLDRVMRAVTGGHGGALIDAWFRRFASTAHSERLGPQRILEDVAATQGTDPTAWDLDAFPFVVTGVHSRPDLRDDTHCGELRVSLASTHPLHQPFHLIALYRQDPRADDLRPDGTAHCVATALRWAALSALDGAAFFDAARAIVDEALSPERFVALETVDFIISPWEWRQWFLVDGALENRPLFQTVDTPRLNADGPDRDAFLAFARDEADALMARAAAIPERFRAPSARVNDGVPWIPLDLGDAGPPALRRQIEIVGCPACHASDADFVQTLPDRTFSPFYEKELVARQAYLAALGEGGDPRAPHGPLQDDPVLPP